MDRVTFVGPGRLGLAFGTALAREDALDGLTFCGRGAEPPAHPLFHDRQVGFGMIQGKQGLDNWRLRPYYGDLLCL